MGCLWHPVLEPLLSLMNICVYVHAHWRWTLTRVAAAGSVAFNGLGKIDDSPKSRVRPLPGCWEVPPPPVPSDVGPPSPAAAWDKVAIVPRKSTCFAFRRGLDSISSISRYKRSPTEELGKSLKSIRHSQGVGRYPEENSTVVWLCVRQLHVYCMHASIFFHFCQREHLRDRF